MTVSRLGLGRFTLAVAVFLAVLTVLFALSDRAARADVPNLVSYGQFKSEASAVATDSATGDVYTDGFVKFSENAETETVKVAGFGGPLSSFDENGTPIKTIIPKGINTGVAVNPANKDVYALSGFAEIDEYAPNTGTLVSSFEVEYSPSAFLGLMIEQIATDSAGHVYVPVTSGNEVIEYSETGTVLKTFTGTGSDKLESPSGVAIDALGDLWIADRGSSGRVIELDSSGAPVEAGGKPVEIRAEGASSIALGAGGEVFVLAFSATAQCTQKQPPCLHLVEYSSTGTQLADVGAGEIEAGGAAFEPTNGWDGQVAVNPSTGRVYVSDLSRQTVFMFGRPQAPEAGREQAVDVTSAGAELGALLNAGGLPTSYRFEYGTSSDYGSSVPAVEGEAAGTTPRPVWAAAAALAPDTTYHFRIVAHNALGSTVGEDQTFTTPPARSACPNEEFRIGFSSTLPDCRAYEMVTPPNRDSAEPDSTKGHGVQIIGGWETPGGGFTSNHAARNGDRFAFWALEVMPEALSSGMEYLATRGDGGWSYKSLIPLQSYENNFCTEIESGDSMQAFSSQLTGGVVRVGVSSSAGTSKIPDNAQGGCNAEGVEVVPGEPLGVTNLLLRDNLTDGFQLINQSPAKSVPTDAQFEGSSSDLGHIFFKENTPLTEDGPPGREALYESDEGTLHLVSELPDGKAVAGSLAAEWKRQPSVVSSDGSRVFFTAEGDLYERIDGEQTVQLDEPQGGSGEGGGGSFQGASADGTQAYFTDGDPAGLTADTVSGSGVNLYRYADGQLTDLTATAHAEVTHVLGVSDENVYFAAHGALTGSQSNQHGETATAGEENVYEWRNGSITFIAKASFEQLNLGSAVASPNGAYLALTSTRSLTGYDNAGVEEIYLYDSASQELSCVSCSPIGAVPTHGGATLAYMNGQGTGQEPAGEGAPHQLTDGGRVFFESGEGLLPTDTNGQRDVYEYEDGQVHLISSGTANSAAALLDVGEEGKDVFFLSRQPLVPQDLGGEGETNIIYDARELGGFPYVASAPACTTAESCRAPASPQPSIYGAPSSQTFSGTGNLASSKTQKPASKKAHKPATAAQKRKIATCRRRFRHNSSKRNACIRKATSARENHSNWRGK